MARARRSSSEREVRMGPVALFTLLSILGLAVLAVLALSTANATNNLAQRRAEATTELYLDELAAQTFVAELDTQLASGADSTEALAVAAEATLATAPGQLQVRTTQGNGTYSASFDGGGGRQLDITVSLGTDGRLAIDKWRMTTVVNDEPAMGNLFGGS